jgi:hypothetical protein
VESNHIISRILLPPTQRRAVVVQYVLQLPIEVPSSAQVEGRADAMFKQIKREPNTIGIQVRYAGNTPPIHYP